MTKHISIIVTLFLLAACSKEISQRSLPDFEPASLDQNGSNWKPILLAAPTEILIEEPLAVNSAVYQQELTEIQDLQRSISSTDKKSIEKWKNSGIIRWNEIARELVAIYNIPPEANPDGTYPAPNAQNPGVYPKFPFANPPYASRAYAYLQVALYDAMVTTWHYKFKYNRMAPAVNSPAVEALEPIQETLPSYPSEDAVVADVAYRLLKVMFPNDTVMLDQERAEQKRAKLVSGLASPSDIRAGEAIAAQIAATTLARYRTDGMGQAGGNPTVWKELEAAAIGRGITMPWKSLEFPARPGMLPLFGNVKQFLITTAQRDSLRPPPPPALNSEEFKTALAEVKKMSEVKSGEVWRIAQLWSDGAATYTPPGHWNEIACEAIAAAKFSELRTARTLALMNMAIFDAGVSCWDAKTFYWYPRPSQVDPSIKTIGLPNFPSYTSGHSTFSAAASTVLGYIFPDKAAQYEAMALEAAESRIYGGIHYRFDSEAGLRCGEAIGSFAIKKGQTDGSN
ncbi:phosphatase PAP2 family protein [Flavihumibacter sp. RY-1]|uniref:Phosphatase PAP2 family protein n=1 Tax=Flavihumibacter fluminis TaxID=2909236 RepID=A0ABS9BMV8_9BACT|nr:phosphatase PAP2 family protein [Flavihumibacter fluminis]MCF1716448.1 phosphatase PAP2 family protein [Flavihumibacter fluminis]